jgi:hypothetical protein
MRGPFLFDRGIGPGLDWRGDGNYVIISSPSSRYTWHSKYNFDTLTPLPVPPELLPREPERLTPKPVERAIGLSPYAEAVVLSACSNIADAPNGEQEGTLHREAFSIGTLAGAGAVPGDWARRMLLKAAFSIPSYNSKKPWRAKEIATKVDRSFDPGFALDQHNLAAAAATAVPGPQQQPHLLLAPDEGCRTPGPGRGKPALDIARRQHAPGRHRLGEPLQLRDSGFQIGITAAMKSEQRDWFGAAEGMLCRTAKATRDRRRN